MLETFAHCKYLNELAEQVPELGSYAFFLRLLLFFKLVFQLFVVEHFMSLLGQFLHLQLLHHQMFFLLVYKIFIRFLLFVILNFLFSIISFTAVQNILKVEVQVHHVGMSVLLLVSIKR